MPGYKLPRGLNTSCSDHHEPLSRNRRKRATSPWPNIGCGKNLFVDALRSASSSAFRETANLTRKGLVPMRQCLARSRKGAPPSAVHRYALAGVSGAALVCAPDSLLISAHLCRLLLLINKQQCHAHLFGKAWPFSDARSRSPSRDRVHSVCFLRGNAMADGWYIKRNEQRYGPFTSTQLVEMAKKGQVLPLDWASRGDGGQWMPASQVKGLFAAPAATAPPPPPATIAPQLPASVPLTASVAAEVAEWHYHTQKGQRAGPVAWSKLRQLATSGELASTAMVWKNGMPAWVTASSIQNLLPTPPAVPSLAPSPPNLSAGPPPLELPLENSQLPAQELAQKLTYPAIGMLIVTGLALPLSLFAVFVMAKGDLNGSPVALALFFFNTVAALLATLRMTMLKEWQIGLAASVLVMTDWLWLFGPGFPVGLALIGAMAGISVGVWCMFLLFQPGMRSCFGQTPPLPRVQSPQHQTFSKKSSFRKPESGRTGP